MAGFFDEQDREDKKDYKKMVVYFIAAVSLAMLLFLVIIYMNNQEKLRKEKARRELLEQQAANYEEQMNERKLEDEKLAIGKNNITSEDLDFWDMYEVENEDDEEENLDNNPTVVSDDNIRDKRDEYADEILKRRGLSDNDVDDREAKFSDSVSSDNIKGLTEEGKISAADKDGNVELYDIIEDLDMNSYDLKGSLFMDNGRLSYKDRKVTSKLGVDVSKYQGTIDWNKVKADDIDYAIIRLGARGYGSGQLKLDDNYVVNVTGAKAAGLDVGVYFYSQAVNVAEAEEEANFAVGASMNYGITYPIVIDVEWVGEDAARADDLDVDERTECVVKFCETVEAFGYTPMIYATRDMLIAGLDMEELTDYDIWLQDDYVEKTGTEFPYEFSMWQYSQRGKVDGISGNVDMNISFTNYEDR